MPRVTTSIDNPHGLTQREKFWALYYATNGGNATRAAREAGYAHPNTAGPRMLVNVGIRAYLSELTGPRNDHERQLIADAREIAVRFTAIARGETFATFVTRDGAVQAPPDHGAMIRALEWLAKMRGPEATDDPLSKLFDKLERLAEIAEATEAREALN